MQRIIDAVIIPTKEYVLYASEYTQGWTTFIYEKLFLPNHEKQELVDECLKTYDDHGKRWC